MIAARYTQGHGLSFCDVARPRIAEDEMLVRVAATSICGTDTKIASKGHRKLTPGQTITLGHEFVGTIEALGARQEYFQAGAMVGIAPNLGCGHCEMCGRGLMNMCPDYTAFGITFDGSHTEFVRVPGVAIAQGCVIPLPDSVSPLDATLAEPLSCVVNGQRAVWLEPGETVLIYGAGPMGLLHLLLALCSGAARVLVVDTNPARLAFARSLGATGVFNSGDGPVKAWVAEQTGGRGVNVVITAAPVRSIQSEGLELLAPFGRLCLFAGLPANEGTAELNTNAIHYKNLYVTGSTGGSPQDYRTALRLIESGRISLKPIVSHVFSLRDLGRAYETALSGRGMKIVMAADEWVGQATPDQAEAARP